MYRNLFNFLDINQKYINTFDGNGVNLQAECDRYEKRIHEVGGINFFLGGVGEDGHLAFNEPFLSLQLRTRVKVLIFDTRIINSCFFDNDIAQVPHCVMFVGVATVLEAREVLIGALRCAALRRRCI